MIRLPQKKENQKKKGAQNMQRRRRRLTVTAFVALAAVFAAAVLLLLAFRVPRQFFRGKGELVLSRVLLVDGGKETDVTGRVDGALLMSSLRLMKTDFFPTEGPEPGFRPDPVCAGRNLRRKALPHRAGRRGAELSV